MMNKHFLTLALTAAVVLGANAAQGQTLDPSIPLQAGRNLPCFGAYCGSQVYQPPVYQAPAYQPPRALNCYSYRQGTYVWTHCN
jgi:hypothetical protein